MRVCAVLLLALIGSAPALAPGSARAANVVARVKVHNPASVVMKGVVVRGMLPLPEGYEKSLDWLCLRDGTRVLQTQRSVFSTYPGSEKKFPVGRPEVVQLIARVDLPANTFKQFDVVELDPGPPTDTAPELLKTGLSAWLRGKGPLVVEATDCYGNVYAAEPFKEEQLVQALCTGPLLDELVYQSTMTPVGKPDPARPPLKKFLRVRAYLTLYDREDFASVALMIHNGSIDNPNGDVYYRSIRVGVRKPMGVHVWEQKLSPAAKTTPKVEGDYTWISCPAPAPNGKVFVMPARGAAVLRTFAYAPKAKKRALLFANSSPIFVPVPSQDLWSWSNFKTARYGSNNYPMPLSIPRPVVDKFLRRSLGSPNRAGWRRLGHAMPAGVPYGGMTGGSGIYYVYGVPAAVSGDNTAIKRHIVLADRHWDRHHAHRFYDKDGVPYIHSRQVVEAGGRKMLQVSLNRRGFVIDVPKDPASAAHAKHVAGSKLLAPEARELLRYMNHDDQHLARVFDATPAAYLACDSISRDRLILAGTHATATLNIYPFRSRPRSGGFGSLFNAKKGVDARPHEGVGFGRAQGWLTHALGYAFYLSKDRQVREDCLDVARAYAEVVEKAQFPAGHVTIHRPYARVFKGDYSYVNCWQTVCIMADGARTLVGMLSSPENEQYAGRLKRVYARVGKWSATVAWNEKRHGPAPNVGLKKKGAKSWLPKPYVPEDKVMRGGHYYGSPYTWYYEITGDRQFIDRLKEMTGGNVAKHATGDLPMWSYALWLAQGGRIPGRPGF